MITITSQNGKTAYGITEFAIDTLQDLQSLPTTVPMGSTAIVIDTGDIYMMNSFQEWKKI